jgi:hypothetical protein
VIKISSEDKLQENVELILTAGNDDPVLMVKVTLAYLKLLAKGQHHQ